MAMFRYLATAVFVTFAAGVTLLSGATPRAQAQQSGREQALTAPLIVPPIAQPPPLIRSQGAETPIRLRSADLRIETDGSLARSTLLLTLYNPNDRLLEGQLEFPLQPGQQVSAFALDVGGELRDAVPVPKNRAQQVFESIERREVDPGLLEQTSGHHFRLRVYPVPARGTRQVRLVLDEAMRREGDAWRLEVPVHLLAGAERFGLRLRAQGLHQPPQTVGAFGDLKFERRGGAYLATVERDAFRSASGLALRFPTESAIRTFVQDFDGERFALIELPIAAAAPQPRAVPVRVGLLWDASASARNRDRQVEFALLDRYFKAMGNGAVALRYLRDRGGGDQRFEIHGGDWSALRSELESAVYDGASDIADWTPESEIGEYLLFSDGLRNYGSRPFPTLSSNQTLYAINTAGAQADATRLAALAEARGGRLVQGQGRAGIEAAARDLLTMGSRIVGLEGEGIDDLQPQGWHADGGLLRIAGRMTEPNATLRVRLREAGKIRTIDVPIAADAPRSEQVATLWANWQVAARGAEPERHRAAVARLGQRFSIVTPGTSLLVLEAAEDYVRYDIQAPPALRAEVEALRSARRTEQTQSRSRRIDEVAARFAQRSKWWERDFPKNSPAAKPSKREQEEADRIEVTGSLVTGSGTSEARRSRRDLQPTSAAPVPPPAPPPPAVQMEAVAADAAAAEASFDKLADEASPSRGVAIRLQTWAPDSPYARRLRAAAPADIYSLYLDERDDYATSTAFYLDVADLLLQKGQRAEALRVLSNLAELGLENRHVLRVLGYRLMQARDYRRAIEVFREVLRLADEEPQSHRDLGLALAGASQNQEAIERLYEVAARSWDQRFSEVELIALNEINAIVATSAAPLDTRFIDSRLLKNMPLDLRVVLSWDSDNSDMDLWVTDPNGERCYYGNRNTYQGGLLSNDFTGGYGPEEFVLKNAKPGKYKIEANFFGDRQQIVTGATTLNLTFSTGWGSGRQKHESVTLRLSGRSETVLVGEFEVK
jgi:Ca-activated chloride channel homolog